MIKNPFSRTGNAANIDFYLFIYFAWLFLFALCVTNFNSPYDSDYNH